MEIKSEQSSFVVSLEKYSCNITLSSVALRQQETTEDELKPTKETIPDNLPSEPCLNALASLRHTKFFQSKCIDVPGLVEVVLLLRDIASRIDTWRVIPLYVLELISYKAIVSHPLTLRVSDAFRRFFEVISTGQFMSPRAPLEDPCEKEQVNPLGHLTKQQRENVICSAQHGLRLIAFDQIQIILGMDRVEKVSRKRNIEDSGTKDTDSKRVKADDQEPEAESASGTDAESVPKLEADSASQADAESAPAPQQQN